MQTQRQARRAPVSTPPVLAGRDFIAAVRYSDGRRDLFHIRNADNLDDARDLVLCEIGEAQAIMVAERH